MKSGLREKVRLGKLPAALPSRRGGRGEITLKSRAMSGVAPPGMSGEGEVRQLRTLYQLLSALSHARGYEEGLATAITALLAAQEAGRAAGLLFVHDGRRP